MRPVLRLASILLCAAYGNPLLAQDEMLIPGLSGVVRGSHYTAPDGMYRVPVPVLPEFGGRIEDTRNVVTFNDDVRTHISIACFPMDRAQQWELETRGMRDYLAFFYAEFVFPSFRTRFRGSSNESTAYTADLKGGALFVFTLLPGGSSFEGKAPVLGIPANGPAVAKRGNLLFVQNNSVFVLSSELAERVTQRSAFQKTPEEENAMLRDRLIELVNRMTIPAPKAAPKTPSS